MKLNAGHTKLIGSRVFAFASLVSLFACCGLTKAQVVNYGTYIVTSVHSGLALTDPGASNTNSTVIEQQTVTNAPSQQWVLTSVGTNVYTLTNASSGQFLDVNEASKANSALVDQFPANGNANQSWNFIHLTGNTYELTSVNSGLALDVDGGGTANGEDIDQYPYGGNSWQQWEFTPVPRPANEINYGCIGACNSGQGAAGTTTFQLTAIASGNWNSAGVHTIGNYQIGHSNQLPNQQIAYFEFNFDSIQGRTVTSAFLLVPGSTDYNIETTYHLPNCPAAPAPCFKIGARSLQITGVSVNEVVNGANSVATANALEGSQNDDLGYGWVTNGLHLGQQFGAWTYNVANLQDEVNAGGNEVLLGGDDFDSGESDLSNGDCPACPGGFENYVWGSTGYNTGIIALITVDGGEASAPVVPNGTYELKNLNSGGALEVAAKTANEEPLDEVAYGGVSKQMWKVTRLANGNYSIRNAGTGSPLQASAEWSIIPATGGNYTLKSVKTGKMLDIAGGSSLMGQGVIQMPAKPGYASQQWSFKSGNANQESSLTINGVPNRP